ncbi:hypothetical protein [Salinarimonas sp.]|uniref:hypothetical protein n=1 Tax=Salinarimonas sp. TaxID=2766526 RepID=UPI0032D9186C
MTTPRDDQTNDETRDEARDETPRPDRPREYSAERARQGEIILNTPTRRALFFGGLIAFVLIALIGAILGVAG